MFGFIKQVLARYGEDEVANRAAALSYYAIFSIGPLLFVILGIVGVIVRNSNARAHLLNRLGGVVGTNTTHLLNGTLSSQGLGSKTGLAFFVGGVGLVLAAIGIFGQLQRALNDIFHVRPGPDAGRKPLIRQKIVSLVFVAVLCLLLLASMFISPFISTLSHDAGYGFGFGLIFLLIDFIGSLAILSLMVVLLYRILPPIKIGWLVLLKASLVVAFMFNVGKLVLGIIIGRNGSISAYGAAGSLIALLLWVFYSSQIVYLGAVGIRVYLDGHPEEIRPRYGGKKGVLYLSTKESPL